MTKLALGLGNAVLFRALGYAFPLISIPLFSRWLGSKAYGQLGLVLTFCSLLQAVCEYGHTVAGGVRVARATSMDDQRLVTASIYAQKVVLVSISLLAGSIYFLTIRAGIGAAAIFFIAFFTIVVPDALTPVWIYYGVSAVPKYAKLQFLSRLIMLFPGLLLVRMWPSPAVGALATGLPFGGLMVFAARGVRSLMVFPSGATAVLSGSIRALGAGVPFFVGALAAASLAPLAMQIASFFDPRGDLGAVYLSIALWTALRQLCMLPHQAIYGRAAARATRSRTEEVPERPAFVLSAMIAAATVVVCFLVPSSLYTAVFGGKYAPVALLLPRVMVSNIPFVFAYGIVLNKIAARRLSLEFSACYVVAATGFVVAFVSARFVSSIYVSLPMAMIAADTLLLLCSLFFSTRRAARLCTP